MRKAILGNHLKGLRIKRLRIKGLRIKRLRIKDRGNSTGLHMNSIVTAKSEHACSKRGSKWIEEGSGINVQKKISKSLQYYDTLVRTIACVSPHSSLCGSCIVVGRFCQMLTETTEKENYPFVLTDNFSP